MKYYSSRNRQIAVDSRTAMLAGLAPDGGLYVPEHIPRIPSSLLNALAEASQAELLFEMLHPFLEDCLSRSAVRDAIEEAFSFATPLHVLESGLAVLELFHGPTCAFKDYGARFMARVFSELRSEDRVLTVLVATSGDTGAAVAAGFHNVVGTEVIILYPSGKVSPLQELQLTTWGANVRALEIEGSFDDCQSMVKAAFNDQSIRSRLMLTSANSINIARLLPQMVYYAIGIRTILAQRAEVRPVYYSVPSGNLGNLTAGFLARQMGIPIEGFFCAVNANATMAEYLNGASYQSRPSVRTLSNAMDVGSPSNFERLFEILGEDDRLFRNLIRARSFDDAETLAAMRDYFYRLHYVCEPHTAVGLLGAESLRANHSGCYAVALATAHPAKFAEVFDLAELPPPHVPETLAQLTTRQKIAEKLPASVAALRDYLLADD